MTLISTTYHETPIDYTESPNLFFNDIYIGELPDNKWQVSAAVEFGYTSGKPKLEIYEKMVPSSIIPTETYKIKKYKIYNKS
jgi:hypothetical protein